MKKRKRKKKEEAPRNSYSGVLAPSVPDRANGDIVFWLGGMAWTRSQMAAHPDTGPKNSPGFNCVNYKAAPVLAAVLEKLGIDSVRALCGLDLKLLEDQDGIGDICLLVAVKIIKHVGKRDVVRMTNRLTGKVQSYAIYVQQDEAAHQRTKQQTKKRKGSQR